jgi:hypothetical protein
VCSSDLVDLCGGHLQAVLDLLAMVHHETECWLEITTLLIPGKNDGDAELKALSAWVAKELGPDVPLHFSAFHPDWKLDKLPPTPPATLGRARRIAMDAGLRYVYTGNVHDKAGDTTLCPGCGRPVVERDWYRILGYALDDNGHCRQCGTAIAGRFGPFGRPFGPQRIPVRIGGLYPANDARQETAMLINCVAYENGSKLADIDIEEISDYLERPDCFVCVALRDATPAELDKMREEFGLHPLAVEDARNGHQRPKIEEYGYGESLFAVVHLLELQQEDKIGRASCRERVS